MWRILTMAAAASIALGQPGQANDLADLAAKTTSMIEAGKPSEALKHAIKLRDIAWDAAPIGFTASMFIDGTASAYGQYTPRANSVFSADQPITVYAEPVGYGYGRNGEDYLIDLDADIELHTPGGQILVRQESFSRFSGRARQKIREFQISFSLTLTGLSAGDYLLVTKLKDAHSEKTGSFSLPFSIPQPEPQPKPAE